MLIAVCMFSSVCWYLYIH